ncbi:hypothetical protein [Albibacterium sp.]|uniref:hypothetical protein n=1 Tax=Albibacterium sp. TaxID=2952885 RepID=UPI002C67BB7C|nr:hypothetical protein [Albibacterium sp.]HUH17979.1 hypothetical protein [Albibacterium sp.]
MNQTFRLLVLTGIFFLISAKGFSQFSVSYYSSSLSKIGLGYDFNEKWRTEVRLYSNTIAEDITPELVLCYNVVSKERHNIYIGIGANINYYTGPVLPLGVEFRPLEKLDKFSLLIELQPSLDVDLHEELTLQSHWGLRYRF